MSPHSRLTSEEQRFGLQVQGIGEFNLWVLEYYPYINY